jgi:hypothetical protein
MLLKLMATSPTEPHLLPASSNHGKITQGTSKIAIDGQSLRPSQDPIQNWYTHDDGPWSPVPKVTPVLLDIISDDGFQSKQTCNRLPHSDFGYGSRRSIVDTSVISSDALERDQDCQSPTGHIENYRPFGDVEEMHQQQHDARSWYTDIIEDKGQKVQGLVCPTCHKSVETQSVVFLDLEARQISLVASISWQTAQCH